MGKKENVNNMTVVVNKSFVLEDNVPKTGAVPIPMSWYERPMQAVAPVPKELGGKEKRSEYAALVQERDRVLAKVRVIEESCEGIDNENNAKRVNELNMEHAKFLVQKQELTGKVAALDAQLKSISEVIATLSSKGIDRILEAIKQQRWYFFKNKTKVLMDRNTGLLWANLGFFDYNNGSNGKRYHKDEAYPLVNNLVLDDYKDWRFPFYKEIWYAIDDKTFPFVEGDNWRIKGCNWWFAFDGDNNTVDIDAKGRKYNYNSSMAILPCCDVYSRGSDYENNVSPNNPVFTERERLQFTLDLFVDNKLWPIFNDNEITQLYKKIYFEKPVLLSRLQELQGQIESLQQVTLLSSEFDYRVLLAKYDVGAIDGSVIKYYQAVQKWCDELLDKVEYYENARKAVIEDFNTLSVQLAAKYENHDKLTEEENGLLRQWQESLSKKLNLGFDAVKNKLLAVHKEADALEDRLEKIDESDRPLHQMAELEREPRASFKFVAENTAKVIVAALRKLEYFEAHHDEFIFIVEKLKAWQDAYIDFKTADYLKLQNSCTKSRIKEEVWQGWYGDWQKQRWEMEKVFLPLVQYALEGHFHNVVNKEDKPVLEQLFVLLEDYAQKLEDTYLEERSAFYIRGVNRHAGEMAQQIEWNTKLNNLAAEIQNQSSKIIFQCADSEDRLFIARLLNPLVNYPLNELVICIKNKCEQAITDEILQGFIDLQKHTYEQYLNDAQRYDDNVKQREREFEDLLFQLNQGLN